ncbi:GDP-mannose 4,6-dehydratase [uncultured Sphingomonas sp.]|uniref:GDP-mannose 4,6-dehydratase n=1 Tax=uncultured Sphingomonas sp. TaxID=158754 RepID=UPI0035CA0898
MRVAVTGANGFTGRYVGQLLDALGIDWVALQPDLTDRAAIAAAVAATPFDRLIHLAAIAFVAAAQWRPFYEVNQLGTLALLEAVARQRPGTRCVLASSAQVYGPQASGSIDEDQPPHPVNAYGVSKLAMELGATPWRGDLDIVVTRPFNYTGVNQEDRYLIPKIVSHFRNRASVIELGNLTVRREFGDVRSVAEAYCGLALSDVPAPVVNLCTGEAHSVSGIVAMLERTTRHRMEIKVNPAFVRPDDVPLLVGDDRRLRALLPKWRPKDLAETLSWMMSV